MHFRPLEISSIKWENRAKGESKWLSVQLFKIRDSLTPHKKISTYRLIFLAEMTSPSLKRRIVISGNKSKSNSKSNEIFKIRDRENLISVGTLFNSLSHQFGPVFYFLSFRLLFSLFHFIFPGTSFQSGTRSQCPRNSSTVLAITEKRSISSLSYSQPESKFNAPLK